MNVSDPESIAKNHKLDKDVEKQLQADLTILLQNEAFLRFVSALIEWCDPMAFAFNVNSTVMAHTLGRQEVGKWIWNHLKRQPRGTLERVTYAWERQKKSQETTELENSDARPKPKS